MARQVKTLVFIGAASFWLLTVGFFVFASWSSRHLTSASSAADGIVVLTGADRRIESGFALLRDGVGSRLLISGVNPRTRPDHILRGRDTVVASREACCVDLGYAAQTTIGNASEAREWAERYRFKRLIVVTSSYHMPRSLNEMALAMPDVEFLAHPVMPRMLGEGPWWLKPSAVRVLAAEYLKLLPSYVRWAAARLLRPIEEVAFGRPDRSRTRAAAL